MVAWQTGNGRAEKLMASNRMRVREKLVNGEWEDAQTGERTKGGKTAGQTGSQVNGQPDGT